MMPEPKERNEENCKTIGAEHEKPENEGGYYYDDAHGYEQYSPEDEDDDEA
ncbi:MAG: hypothetical protein IT173_04510 [Acidobacteria bacterium]|nr:hypothetical protein [Acidobacteriota bacterium]